MFSASVACPTQRNKGTNETESHLRQFGSKPAFPSGLDVQIDKARNQQSLDRPAVLDLEPGLEEVRLVVVRLACCGDGFGGSEPDKVPESVERSTIQQTICRF